MTISDTLRNLSPMALADVLTKDNVMDHGIRPLWDGMPRLAGPIFTVRCAPGDNLMVHAAIYRAPAGSVLVIEANDLKHAVAGGNVCAVAKKHGIAGFVIDGVIRDLAEIREHGFPVFARGLSPIPGGKEVVAPLNEKIRCGGIDVHPGDYVVADEEGVVVVPKEKAETASQAAAVKAAKDLAQSLGDWEKAHRKKIDEILQKKGFAS